MGLNLDLVQLYVYGFGDDGYYESNYRVMAFPKVPGTDCTLDLNAED